MHKSIDSIKSGKPLLHMRLLSLYSNVTSTGTKALQQMPTFNAIKKYYYGALNSKQQILY